MLKTRPSHPPCPALTRPRAAQDSSGGPDVAVAVHPNHGDRVVLLQQDNRLAAETFEEVRRVALGVLGRWQ